eukprot:Selendium_serpulae@DN7283_c0_g1_i1.p2
MTTPSEYRTVAVNAMQGTKFSSNRVRTAMFTLFTFLPLFLYDQFRRPANLYFLFIAVAGVVVYTGHDTKIFRNSREAPFKTSQLTENCNRWLIYCLFILMLIVLSFTFLSWLREHLQFERFQPYAVPLKSHRPLLYRILITAGEVQILFGGLLPLSIYFNLSLSRTMQSYLCSFEGHLRDALTGEPAFEIRSTEPNDDVGQVQYVFSDKTGTLTLNKMSFVRCGLAGRRFGEDPPRVAHATPHVELEDRELRQRVNAGDREAVMFPC